MIRAMTDIDCSACAGLHHRGLDGEFLPQLGKNFLTSLYRGFMASSHFFGIVETDAAGTVVGFVVGTDAMAMLMKDAIRNRFWELSSAVVARLLRAPLLFKSVLRTLFYNGGNTTGIAAELVVIVVAKDRQNTGCGTRLLQALNIEFHRIGVPVYRVTVNDAHQEANQFYQKKGFVIGEQFRMYGKKMNDYTYKVNL